MTKQEKRTKEQKKRTFFAVMDWIEIGFSILVSVIAFGYLLSHLPH